jgi:hypothetical protein
MNRKQGNMLAMLLLTRENNPAATFKWQVYVFAIILKNMQAMCYILQCIERKFNN